jgi:hypothetical protein
MTQSTLGNRQARWQAPKLQELGNLRDFVRTGNANGKSGPHGDGNSMCGGEAMLQSGTCA